jgi:hypothetical protein
MAKLKILINGAPVAWYGCQIALTLSASIGVYRAQAEVFGGRSDGKFGVRREEVSYYQVLIRAGDN